ncbi:MAG: hypothetical protein J6B24_13870, partial [Clostridia bacterium]|nr:hypothetical protein [Clostridia bacterium]
YQERFLYGGKQIISLREMSIYRLLIHRFAVPLPSQGKAHEETQQPENPNFTNQLTFLPKYGIMKKTPSGGPP